MTKQRFCILAALLLLLSACGQHPAATPGTAAPGSTLSSPQPSISGSVPSPELLSSSSAASAAVSADVAPSGGPLSVLLPKGPLPQTAYAPAAAPQRRFTEVTTTVIPRNDYGRLWPYVGGYAVQAWMSGDIIGLCDEQGRVVCDPVYNRTEILEKDGKKLYKLTENRRNAEGKDVSRITLAALDGKWAKDYDGVAYKFPGWEYFGGTVFDWRPALQYDAITVCQNGRWGVIDYSGQELLPCSYNNPVCFVDGLAAVTSDDGQAYTYIDLNGNTVLGPYQTPPQQRNETDMNEDSDRLMPRCYGLFFSEGLARYYENGKYGAIDRHGNIVIPAAYDVLTPFYRGLAEIAVVSTPDFKRGIIDSTGHILYEPGNFWLRMTADGDVLLDTAQGPVALDPKTGAQTPWINPDPTSASITSGGSIGVIIERNGEKLSFPDAVYAVLLDNGTIALTNREGGTWYIADRSGKMVAGPFAGRAESYRDGLIYVTTRTNEMTAGPYNAYKTVYDCTGKRVLPEVYLDILPLDGRFLVRQESCGGLLDAKGNWIIKTPLYDYLTD